MLKLIFRDNWLMLHTGVIAVLDVLGWQNRVLADKDLEKNWQIIAHVTAHNMKDTHGLYKEFSPIKYQAYVVDTDMFILAAWRDDDKIDFTLAEYVSLVLNGFILAGLSKTIRLRGCISAGTFDLRDDLFLTGKPLDEAINEHNKINWVGCHTTQSATTIFNEFVPKYKILTNTFVGVTDPPFKDAELVSQRWVLNWVFAYFRQTDEPDIRQVLKNEIDQAKNDKIKEKFENMLRFFEKSNVQPEAKSG